MTTGIDDRFDAQARAAHQRALQSLSPRTLAQLQLRRRTARVAPGRRVPAAAWSLAAACAVGVLAVGLQWRQPDLPAPSGAAVSQPMETFAEAGPPPAAGTPAAVVQPDEDSGVLALSESPEMYAWLESSEAVTLAME